MSFNIELATDADFRDIVTCVFEAYEGENDYINAVFPRNSTEEGLEYATQRCIYSNRVSENIKWYKVTDTVTGNIIGGAMWNICKDMKPPDTDLDGPPGTWENEVEKEYAQALYRSCKEYERKFWRKNELPLLSMIGLVVMAITPKHQNRGAGSLLMEEGMKIADEIGTASTIEATDAGIRLYEKYGFVVQMYHVLNVPEKSAARPKVMHFFMTRERREKRF